MDCRSTPRKLVFVIDTSGSMTGLTGSSAAKRELSDAIRNLSENTQFAIVVFNGTVDVWQQKLVPANEANKKAAIVYVQSQMARASYRVVRCAGNGLHFRRRGDLLFVRWRTDQRQISWPRSTSSTSSRPATAAGASRSTRSASLPACRTAPMEWFMKTLAEQNCGPYRRRRRIASARAARSPERPADFQPALGVWYYWQAMKLPWSIADARQAIATGTLKPSELVAECLRRIDRWESKVHAWASSIASGPGRGTSLGHAWTPSSWQTLPLAGIPLGIKDIFDVAGLPTRAGSPLTSADAGGRGRDGVARLRAAGAIILGKTVTTEFAYIDPPATRNPWNLSTRPADRAAGRRPPRHWACAWDRSVRKPAVRLFVRPRFAESSDSNRRFGRIDRAGVVVSSPSLDHVGALAGNVADLEVLWRVLADPQPAALAGVACRRANETAAAEHHHLPCIYHAQHKAERP